MTTNPYAVLGEQLKEIREEVGLPKRRLSRLLFVNRKTIDRMESGDRRTDLIEMKRLAAVYEQYGLSQQAFFNRLLL